MVALAHLHALPCRRFGITRVRFSALLRRILVAPPSGARYAWLSRNAAFTVAHLLPRAHLTRTGVTRCCCVRVCATPPFLPTSCSLPYHTTTPPRRFRVNALDNIIAANVPLHMCIRGCRIRMIATRNAVFTQATRAHRSHDACALRRWHAAPRRWHARFA